jgi:signal transduction histidine kinase
MLTGVLVLTTPAVISVIVAGVAGLFAILTVGLSFGPGWRELRIYAICAAMASLFAAASIFVAIPASASTVVLAQRVLLFAAGIHGSAWFAYAAALERRPLTRVERRMVILGIVLALGSLVPGAFISNDVTERRVGWLGWTYHDAPPTLLGGGCYATYCLAVMMLTRHYWVRWRRGEDYAAAHFFGIGALVIAGLNDSLTSARVYAAPNLLGLGLLTAIGCVGGALTTRFVAAARSLEEQSSRLRATQAALVQRERLAALGELSAVVAHKIRNPISIMFNAITVLSRIPDATADRATLVTIIDDEARRLMRMVNDLLAFASPQALRLSRTPLAPLLAGAAEAAQAIAPAGAQVRIEIHPGVPALECDERLVHQAVLNLITNAIQAAPSEAVHVSAVPEPGEPKRVRIAVVDRGEGVPPDSVPRLFTPFFTTRPTGTGLGLAIVRRVAEAHGGDVMLVPTEGRGATFWLRLPVDGASGRAQIQ